MKLTANTLKLIAIISMVVDHIGYYLYFTIPNNIYIVLRIIGRIAMPIFSYYIVEGFFKTSNLKKYIIRIFKYALITQIVISVIAIINIKFFDKYVITVYTYINILFSFGLSLIIITLIENIINKKIIKNIKYKKEKTFFVISIILIIFILITYLIIDIDYEYTIPIIITIVYLFRKIGVSYINKYNIKKENRFLTEKIFSLSGLTYALLITNIYFDKITAYNLLSVVLIMMYNGKLKKEGINKMNINKRKNQEKNIAKKFFYHFFYIHHAILYVIAIIIRYII